MRSDQKLMVNDTIVLIQSNISNTSIIMEQELRTTLVVAHRHKCVTINATGCGFDPHFQEMKYLFKFIFPILHSGVEAKRGVEFRQSVLQSHFVPLRHDWPHKIHRYVI